MHFSKNSPVLSSSELQYAMVKVHVETEDKLLLKDLLFKIQDSCLESNSVLQWVCEKVCIGSNQTSTTDTTEFALKAA